MKWHKARRQQEKWNYLKGGVTLSGTLFLALSFFSHSPQDPSFNSFGLSIKVSNYCGYVGAFLSDLFYQGFGLTAWLFIPLGFFLSFKFFQNRWTNKFSQNLILFTLFLISVSCLLNLYFPTTHFYKDTVSLGGAFALVILRALQPFFHKTGMSLILWSIVTLSFLVYGQQPFFKFLFFFQKAVFKSLKIIFIGFQKTFSFTSHQAKNLFSKDWGFLFKKIESFILKRNQLKKSKPSAAITQDFINPEPQKAIPEAAFQKAARGRHEIKSNVALKSPPKPQEEALASSKPAPLISLHGEEKSVKAKFTLKDRPNLDFLMDPPATSQKVSREEVELLARKLMDKFSQFSIEGRVTAIKTGPAVIMFEFKPEADVKLSRIKEMATDLSLALSSESVRIIAPIPGRDVVGIEASSPYRANVYLKNMLKEKDFLRASLPLVLGRRSDNLICIRDLAKIPHLLIAGTTGSGKSVFVISFITSLLFRHTPETLRMILIDPKRVDLAAFNEVPHLLSPIVASASQSIKILNWAIAEMEKRYRSLSKFGARDIRSFNEHIKSLKSEEKKEHQNYNADKHPQQTYYFEPLPFICIIIEEFGDLMADTQYRKGIEQAVVRLAQKARASGIHLVLAMQSPRKDVVTGLIKTNIPGRISFKVASGTDSRVILDEVGAERLLSHGDMLFLEPGTSKALRYHGPFVNELEVAKVVEHWRAQGGAEYAIESFDSPTKNSLQGSGSYGDMEMDSMYEEIFNYIVENCESVSASLLQRKFRIGYPRAARLIEVLSEEGVIGPPRGSKPREVLIHK